MTILLAIPYLKHNDSPSHKDADLQIYFRDADVDWRRDCCKICVNIERMLSGWIGERQLFILKGYIAGYINRQTYNKRINEITIMMRSLAETSLLRKEWLDDG